MIRAMPSTGRHRGWCLAGRPGRLFTISLLLASSILAVGVAAAPSALADAVPAPGSTSQLITVNAATSSSTTATVTGWQRGVDGTWRVAIGPVTGMVGATGIGPAVEGSSHTPAGTFALTQAFGRQANPGTRMPYFRTDTFDWWDENPSSPTYNLHVRRSGSPGGASENLYYSGSVYDYVVNMNYNTARVPGAGSAFFLHVSDGTPTAGCVSVPRSVMVAMLRWLDPAQHPYISIKVGAAWKPPPAPPIGHTDSMRSTAQKQITVVGWAADPGSPAVARIVVSVVGPAGSGRTAGKTGLARPDVVNVYRWPGPRTGFQIVVPAQGLGRNLVCVSIVPAMTPTTTRAIGCGYVLVRNEVGRLDFVSASGPTITAVGWALNPNNPTAKVAIRIFDTGRVSQAVGDVRAVVNRPDVAHYYPGYGPAHGYHIAFRALATGNHVICAVALPEYGSWSAQTLGCKAVTVR